jgi:hypothetical protein
LRDTDDGLLWRLKYKMIRGYRFLNGTLRERCGGRFALTR